MRFLLMKYRPRSLNDAVQQAVQLEAYQISEKKYYARHFNVDPSSKKLVEIVKALSAKIDALQNDVRDLQVQHSPYKFGTLFHRLNGGYAIFVENRDTCGDIAR